jgi:hypothetical protein
MQDARVPRKWLQSVVTATVIAVIAAAVGSALRPAPAAA